MRVTGSAGGGCGVCAGALAAPGGLTTVLEEVANGTNGWAVAERLLPVFPSLHEESQWWSSIRAFLRYSLLSLFSPTIMSLAS